MPLRSRVRKDWPLFVSGALAIMGLIVFRVSLNWDALGLTVKLQDLTGLLAPVAFAAAVIERAVEILISPWRDADATKLESAVAAVKARPANPDTKEKDASDLKEATEKLADYRGETQRYAFAVS